MKCFRYGYLLKWQFSIKKMEANDRLPNNQVSAVNMLKRSTEIFIFHLIKETKSDVMLVNHVVLQRIFSGAFITEKIIIL